ncbi:IclR family transcriptional regulator [Antrihabitans sp. YC3-6]|uniref:IclR family transcriptional regulator n=1 Tax=Antrihabitans stalagmiti TaxID=2799499 RepID=A0A934NMR8_9NOCA|nr:IclR family transcriptional regulator [Antrihabitans stalagmiti]MBJ8338059.1 IclR family transcriptional regulator [Antrihabitans stalagmiti]
MAGNTGRPGASVISRALALLSAFDQHHRSLTLTDLAERAELPTATAYRQVNELVDGGALIRNSNGEYMIGRMIWNLGLLAPVQTGLREVASPFLHDIYAATRATVHLAVREGDRVLYVDRLSGHASVPVVSKVGSTLPMHCTGVGKVLLAYAPADVHARAMAALTRVTPFTITQPVRLNEQLSRIRRDGYATTIEEMTLGACSVAVPITGGIGGEPKVIAALGIVVPSLKRDRPRLTAALHVAAQGISRSMPAT